MSVFGLVSKLLSEFCVSATTTGYFIVVGSRWWVDCYCNQLLKVGLGRLNGVRRSGINAE